MNYEKLKDEIFQDFHSVLAEPVSSIQSKNITRNKKATQVNNAVEEAKSAIEKKVIAKYSTLEKSKLYMLIQYCYTVMSFEYRNKVWPYEYMAFSRRNGELWERFCKAAWDHSTKKDLHRIEAPAFQEVEDKFIEKISNTISNKDELSVVLAEVKDIFELVGEINMAEDEMFCLENVNHIIDFKSGFGSNEKGNTLRLLAVGKAYEHWDENIELLFLVRQNENNNYLEKIRKSNLWTVYCGDDAYKKIDELTDAGICEIRKEAIDFANDLSGDFWSYLVDNNIEHYLEW